jgi:hypothetical protein
VAAASRRAYAQWHATDARAAGAKYPETDPVLHSSIRRGTALIASPASGCASDRLSSCISAAEASQLPQQPVEAVDADLAEDAPLAHVATQLAPQDGIANEQAEGDAPLELAIVVYVAPPVYDIVPYVPPELAYYQMCMQAHAQRYVTAAMAALAAAEQRELDALPDELRRCWLAPVGGAEILYAFAELVLPNKPTARFAAEQQGLEQQLQEEQADMRAQLVPDIAAFIDELRLNVEAHSPGDLHTCQSLFIKLVDAAVGLLSADAASDVRADWSSVWDSWLWHCDVPPLQLQGRRVHSCLRADLLPLRLFRTWQQL